MHPTEKEKKERIEEQIIHLADPKGM